jgi:CubicO group peptidase (beta-lactamase class C family)
MTNGVRGRVSPGFERVRAVFEEKAAHVGDGGAAFSAYVDGRPAVDLWTGRASPERPWEEATVAPLFSSTKGLAATCLLVLADRGQLDPDAPVARYWPEFAQGGKDRVLVRQLLSHTAGLTEIPDYEDLVFLDGTGLTEIAEIRRRLAAAKPAWEPGTRNGYHGITIGYLMGALVERISGRELGAFFAEEIGGPLGVEAWITGDDAVLARRAYEIELAAPPPHLAAHFDAILADARDGTTLPGRAFAARDGIGLLDRLAVIGNDPRFLAKGLGFGDGVGTARGMARLYAALGRGGELDGVRLASPRTIDAFATLQSRGPDAVLKVESGWGIGYQVNLPNPLGERPFGPSERAFGHGGAGGQLGFCDPERGLGFGFVRSHLAHLDPLAANLIAATYESL